MNNFLPDCEGVLTLRAQPARGQLVDCSSSCSGVDSKGSVIVRCCEASLLHANDCRADAWPLALLTARPSASCTHCILGKLHCSKQE
jgi:hypothetical protein